MSRTSEPKQQKLLLTVGEDLEKEESEAEVQVQISLGALSNKHMLDGRGKGGCLTIGEREKVWN